VGFLDDEVGVVALHVVTKDWYLHVLVVEVEVAVLVSRSPVRPAQVAVVPHPVGAQTLVAEAAVLRPSEFLPVMHCFLISELSICFPSPRYGGGTIVGWRRSVTWERGGGHHRFQRGLARNEAAAKEWDNECGQAMVRQV
jgi:hypothetical protein